ncbi:MAG TPA: VOC family protein [Chloroflexota bacterium]|nr:VOC family protein [Chloroflexota bacterium]
MEKGMKIQGVQQVGIVVKDVEKTAEAYWQQFGIGPWQILTFGPGIKKRTYHGEECAFSLRIAMAQVGPLIIELLQPLEGPSPHADFLAQHGEGVQHLGIFVESLAQATEQMQGLGYRDVTSAFGIGADGSGGATYFDTDRTIGTLLEIIEMPKELSSPIEKVIPNPGS